jgi:hypothetical protein
MTEILPVTPTSTWLDKSFQGFARRARLGDVTMG